MFNEVFFSGSTIKYNPTASVVRKNDKNKSMIFEGMDLDNFKYNNANNVRKSGKLNL